MSKRSFMTKGSAADASVRDAGDETIFPRASRGPGSRHVTAAGGGAGAGEPPLSLRPSIVERAVAFSRWFALAAVPALCIGGLLVYWQKSVVRPAAEPPSLAPVEGGGMVPGQQPLTPAAGAEPRRVQPTPVREGASATPMEPPSQQSGETQPELFAESALAPLPAPVAGPLREPFFDSGAALASAAALAEQGRVAEAEEAYRAIVARDPGLSEAYLALGEIALERGDFQAATKYFRLTEAIIMNGE